MSSAERQKQRLAAGLLKSWPDGAVPRWWIQDEAQALGVPYEELWQLVRLLGFRIEPKPRPEGRTGIWAPPPKRLHRRVQPEVVAAFLHSTAKAVELVDPVLTTRERILAILESRFPCKVAPKGSWTVVAEELGVSGEWVRQVATEAGWAMGPALDRRQWYACVCGKVQRSSELCNDCRYVTLPCEGCGGPVRTSAAQLASRVSRQAGPLSYTGRVFCGRPCLGRWVGRNRAERSDVEGRERLRLLLEDGYPSREVPWGTWRRLAQELGVSAGWVGEVARKMGWRREEPASKRDGVAR